MSRTNSRVGGASTPYGKAIELSRLWIACTTCAVASTFAMANDNPVAKFYFDKPYWERMNWSAANSSPLWRVEGWQDFTGKQDEKFIFERARKVTLLGRALTAHVGRKAGIPLAGYFFSTYGNVSQADCDALTKEFSARFGRPIFRDASLAFYFSETSYFEMVSFDYQWDLGPTRVDAGCFGGVSPESNPKGASAKMTWSVRYGSTIDAPALAPTFALRCTRRAEFTSDMSSRDLDDLLMLIDIQGKKGKDVRHVSITDDKSFSADESEIRFKMTQKSFVTSYTINRISGALAASVMQDAKAIARIRGSCEKVERLEKKF